MRDLVPALAESRVLEEVRGHGGDGCRALEDDVARIRRDAAGDRLASTNSALSLCFLVEASVDVVDVGRGEERSIRGKVGGESAIKS